MARRYALRDYEDKGIALEVVIPALVNDGGQKHAAENLGVSQASISKWLKDHDYTAKIYYEKKVSKEK